VKRKSYGVLTGPNKGVVPVTTCALEKSSAKHPFQRWRFFRSPIDVRWPIRYYNAGTTPLLWLDLYHPRIIPAVQIALTPRAGGEQNKRP
jgi:hypothetical protein